MGPHFHPQLACLPKNSLDKYHSLSASILQGSPLSSDLSADSYPALVAEMVENLPAMKEIWVQPLSQEDPMKKRMATYFSILAWRIPWTERTGGLQSMRSQRVRQVLETNTSYPVLKPYLPFSLSPKRLLLLIRREELDNQAPVGRGPESAGLLAGPELGAVGKHPPKPPSPTPTAAR